MNKVILITFLIISIPFSFLPINTLAEPDKLEQERVIDDKRNFSLTFENDFFSNDDDNYTNGVRFAWLSPETTTPHWLEKIADATPFFSVLGNKRIAYSLGQNIYTPEDTISSNLVRGERPYSGWLYASAGLISDTGSTLERLEVTLGVVGPSSLAEQTQRDVHRMRGIDVPNGWDNQLEDELG